MNQIDKEKDGRYPYTHAADLIRSIAGYTNGSTNISRSDASAIRQLFSYMLGMDDELVASKLADYFLEHREELADRCVNEILRQIGS